MNSRVVLYLVAAALSHCVLLGQNPAPSAPGADLSGMYTPDRDLDPGLGTAAGRLVDYGGIPLNEAGRMYALAWDASRITVRQQQCAGYVPPYMFVAPGNYRIFEDRDPYTQQLKSISVYGQIAEGHHEIFMDGRPHPPAYAVHTFPGFSTGKFEGNILTVETTHIKRGWIRAPRCKFYCATQRTQTVGCTPAMMAKKYWTRPRIACPLTRSGKTPSCGSIPRRNTSRCLAPWEG